MPFLVFFLTSADEKRGLYVQNTIDSVLTQSEPPAKPAYNVSQWSRKLCDSVSGKMSESCCSQAMNQDIIYWQTRKGNAVIIFSENAILTCSTVFAIICRYSFLLLWYLRSVGKEEQRCLLIQTVKCPSTLFFCRNSSILTCWINDTMLLALSGSKSIPLLHYHSRGRQTTMSLRTTIILLLLISIQLYFTFCVFCVLQHTRWLHPGVRS